EGVKELSDEIDLLKKQNEVLEKKISKFEKNTSTSSLASNQSIPSLFQNYPNPFKQNTDIKFYLPEEINKAELLIFNMNGIHIKTLPIITKGNSSITILGNELQPGMYFYSLIVDGKEIDTKRMILTE
ncbi:MAG: T9SS type A sorting domain-containing protein, partial [Bacteroidia bacterium]|nr:T9SS type A sorting domain-containing protein [Bacteroidia bacterium]